ncbi:MAG: hypothetical protein JXQ23_12765 [Clostridia bacterium]|nr:hypothetical protein [Clostridia bacterium]
MYWGKNYFYYKNFAGLMLLLVLPFMTFAIGVYMLIYSPYPFLFGSVYGFIALVVGMSRSLSGIAMRRYQKFHIRQALAITTMANKWIFVPPCVRVFHAHLLILKEHYREAEDILSKLGDKDLVYADTAKMKANMALVEWKLNDNLEGALENIKKSVRKGCDESISYVLTRLYLEKEMFRETRTYIEDLIQTMGNQVGLRQNLVMAYFQTTQNHDAKLHFRVLYYDLNGANKDTLYFMGKLKMEEKKVEDGIEFMKKALTFEKTSIDIVDDDRISKELVSYEESI